MFAGRKLKAKAKAKKKPTPADDAVAKTLGDVAKHFAVSFDTVRKNWRPNWGKECGKAGAWDLAAIAAWRDLSQSRGPGADKFDNASIRQAKARKTLADARIKEADASRRERLNRLAEAGVVFREDVEAFLSEFFRFLRDGLKGMIEDIGPELPRTHKDKLTDSLQQRATALLRALRTQSERLVELDDAAS